MRCRLAAAASAYAASLELAAQLALPPRLRLGGEHHRDLHLHVDLGQRRWLRLDGAALARDPLVELDLSSLKPGTTTTFTTPVSRCKQRVGGHDISLWVAGRQWLVTRLLASARAMQRYLGVVMKCLRP